MEVYYAVKVKMTVTGDDGKESRVTEYALVPAISVSDSETKAIEHYTNNLGFADITVISAAPSQIATVVGVSHNDADVLEEAFEKKVAKQGFTKEE